MTMIVRRNLPSSNTAATLLLMICLTSVAKGESARNAPLPPIGTASWIWGDMQSDVCEFRIEFTLEHPPEAASVLITADNGYELYVNGAMVGFDIGAGSDVWSSIERWDIKSRLMQGRNVLGIRGICLGGQRGVVAAVRVDMDGAEPFELVTNPSWRVTSEGEPDEYSHPDYREGKEWVAANALGPMGMAPWGNLKYTGSVGGRRTGTLPARLALSQPDPGFAWPRAIAFIADDCSIYKKLRGEAWGIEFRIDDWTRAYTMFDLPCPSKIGRKLVVLDPLGPDAKPRVLIEAGQGVIGSPSTSYDGKSIYVAMAPEGTSFFHIYRVPVDGTAPQQLTSGPFHDIDPAELPDGRIVFTSTRIGTFEEYHAAPSRALFVMQPDGSRIQSITHTPIFDNEPKVLADGRIAFIRSDNFFGRAKVETQIHAVRPDGTAGHTEVGTDVGAVYGHRLRLLGYGSPAPLPDGRLAVISSHGNFVATPGGAESSFHRLPGPGGLGDLAPLPDGRLLATVLNHRAGDRRSRVLAVIDPADNRLVKVYESDDVPIHSPVFVGARPRPPLLPDTVQDDPRVGLPSATGFLYAQNVHITRKTHADWGQIRAIRVLRSRGKSMRSSHWDFVHQGKEVTELGTVPIGPDGSFSVEVPADVPLALQAVDAQGRSELNEMSWLYVRPGEKRSCVGCHEPRRATPPVESRLAEAQRAKPLKLLLRGEPHRWRGNNSGVSGMMDLQFERFRETASLNLYRDTGATLEAGGKEVAFWADNLRSPDEVVRISAANRLALFRDRTAAPALAGVLRDESREVRVAVAMAIAACGTRDSVPPLVELLEDPDINVAQAAAVALENLTAHSEPLRLPVTEAARKQRAGAWRTWLSENPWSKIEASLIRLIDSEDRVVQWRAIVTLGHIGGDAARAALRDYVAREKGNNPYPPFVNNNRTDHFTFSADSPLNPRTLQAATRALGHLADTGAVPLLREVLADHIDPESGNLFLAEAAAEALGWIGTPEAETVLIDTFARLGCYSTYVGWYSDHPALYACHASPVHARIIEALDRMGSTRAGAIVPHVIRSVPTDPDRALYLETDTYELLAGRVIRRSGRGDELIATCLAMLGDPGAEASEELRQAVSTTVNAWAGHPCAENRAAQLLSAACRELRYAPAVRAAYDWYRAKPEETFERALNNPQTFQVRLPHRHWVLLYLGRTLGNLDDPSSVETLIASLAPELNEARHGRPDPAEPNIHLLQLEATPCWRAAAAWALGHIGDRRAVPVLLEVVANLDNAVDTRYAAAEALGRIADPDTVPAIAQLAADYPEISVRRKLLEACE
ncbi:MAG: HEAT repeat domain-containing protein [Thermoguttaceae bacterium]|jgi:HEAT repeat protein|nr:HEAT repeat domain-containing protein [Thermoguttaceae bacterium]